MKAAIKGRLLDSGMQDSPFAFFQTDEKGIITGLNKKAKELFPEEIKKGKNVYHLFNGFESKKEMFLTALGDEKFLIFPKKYNCSIFYLAVPGERYDAKEKKIEELNKINLELDAIIENSYDGIYITDNKGNTLKTNSAIERISGIPKHYYIGKNIHDLIKRGILRESVTMKVLKAKKTVNVVQKNFNGKETLMTGSPLFNEKGEIEKVVTNIRDLTELNDLHKKLNEVKKLNKEYKKELEKLKAHTKQDPDVVVKSRKMTELFTTIERLANVDTTVLFLGETGVGKDVLARHLYRVSNRIDNGKFIKINCGAIPKDLLESELFGYEGGAFSGASKNGKPGVFEMAHNGILFLDEVGEMPESLQVKLLRVLQEKEIQRVGGTTSKIVDVRVIAATNKNLKKMVKKGTFREDLYYRLHVVPMWIPPLRERRDDILPMVQSFVDKYNKKYELAKVMDRSLKEFFYHYDWPGNVRELSNVVERLMLTVPSKELMVEDLSEDYRQTQYISRETTLRPLKEAVEEAEYNLLKIAAERCQTTYEIAKQLDTSQATIVRKLKKHQLQAGNRNIDSLMNQDSEMNDSGIDNN